MKVRAMMMVVSVVAASACGGGVDDKQKGTKFVDPANNSSANNVNNIDPAKCGDGALDPGEMCDPGIESGEGACPASCQAPACMTATLAGSAEQCTAQCEAEPVACADGDGCCPAGCDATNDGDCTNTCGDGVIDGPEVCDGNCPTQCNDANACTKDIMRGDPAACSAVCEYDPVTACVDGDGCCPSGCDGTTDSDCTDTATCGDGMVNGPETCDGNCPTQCNDSNACTTDRLSGSAATCDAACNYTEIVTCQSGDGCCPSGCTSTNDSDCACEPRTCADAGAACGPIDDGCGGTVTCPDTCSDGYECSGNSCVQENRIGERCTDYPQCGSSQNAACLLPDAWPGGYCTLICNNETCPAGSHCVDFDLTNELCMLDCTSNSQCDPGYVCRNFDGIGGKECAPPEVTGELGDPCGTDSDCASDLECVTSTTDSNNNTTTYPGGICTVSCTPILGTCPDGATQYCSLDFYCMPKCASDLDCRSGYDCVAGFDGSSYCMP